MIHMSNTWEKMEEVEIAIVGGGVCGLATALALHRKGIASVVFERSESLRAAGAGIGFHANGWLALQQLGVASHFRDICLPFYRERDIWLHNDGKQQESPIDDNVGEARCLKRSDLINILADSLPSGTVRLGCQLVSLKIDPLTSYPTLHFLDGSVINAKAVIGCEGTKSVVGDFLGLKPLEVFSMWAARGLTRYPKAHPFADEFVRISAHGMHMGRIPVNNKLFFWFLGHRDSSKDSKLPKDPKIIRQLTLDSIKNFPAEMREMVENSEQESLSLTRLRYRAPRDILVSRFSKGNVTVAGDAMHVMGPFLGQGASAALEDAVVLAQCLARKLPDDDDKMRSYEYVGEAFDEYVKKRRMRIARLSTHSYLIGLLLQSSSPLAKLLCIVLMKILFWNANAHTQYDCGLL